MGVEEIPDIALWGLGVLMFFLGASIQSAVDCFAYRRANNESWVKGRSHCEMCGHALGFIDLIPCLGGFIRQGRCKYCGRWFGYEGSIREGLNGVCLMMGVAFLGLTADFAIYALVLEMAHTTIALMFTQPKGR